jgi:hypothetical protein
MVRFLASRGSRAKQDYGESLLLLLLLLCCIQPFRLADLSVNAREK